MLVDRFDSVLFDLDGVIYQGDRAIAGAVQSVNRVAEAGIKVGYITNNSSRRSETIAEQLSGFGIVTSADQIIGSARAGVKLLSNKIQAGQKVLVVGGDGLRHEVQQHGFEVVDKAHDKPAAVIQGFSKDVSWRELAEASFAIQSGAIWVATNQDWTIPVEQGIAPGNGTLVGAVHTAVGILPDFAGKPFGPIFAEAQTQLAIERPLMVGDRLDTDIRGARSAGFASAVVMTGIATAKDLLGAKPEDRPDYLLEDLTGLFVDYQQPRQTKRGCKVGSAAVELLGNKVMVTAGEPGSFDALKAACHLIWNCGTPIYALEIEPSLYS